jgi:acyl-CoA dehydrogenase
MTPPPFLATEHSAAMAQALTRFVNDAIIPAEAEYAAELAQGDPHGHPAILEDLKRAAREQGLWNLFLPDTELGAGLSNVEYAPLAEISGRSPLAPEAINCAAPDSGNMELLAMFGTDEQKRRWLDPLLEGHIRSAFAMTEPAVASSDATNVCLTIRRDGDDYVLNGRKWWITNAMRERCKVFIVMGKTDLNAESHRQQSMILVPRETPGLTVVRNLTVFGYSDPEGHAEVLFDDVRVPAENLLGGEGDGFLMSQARLGPGRIHHCMRIIGAAERALTLLCRRAETRSTFGAPVASRANIQDWIAESRIEIEMARLLVLKTAWLMDTVGNKGARTEIAAIKVAVPQMALKVIDRAIQVHGAGGLSQDFSLARMYADVRGLRLADGPDEVHKRSIARFERRRQIADTDGRG